MAEFIGSRISLISKRDIRYVGTLHEISSENSTVALEQVVSFGTEGRRPDDEVPPSDNVYEYIVFRGSDVKDLRIEETPNENKATKPQIPDDPAILGSARRPTPSSVSQAPDPQASAAHASVPQIPAPQAPGQQQQQQPLAKQPQQPPQALGSPQPQQLQHNQHGYQSQQRQQSMRYPQHAYPYFYPPAPNQRFGMQGFPPGPNFPGMPYGAPPPGWFPPGQGFHYPPPGNFLPPQPPIGSASQQQALSGSQISTESQTPVSSQNPAGSRASGGLQASINSQDNVASQVPQDPQITAGPHAPETSHPSQAQYPIPNTSKATAEPTQSQSQSQAQLQAQLQAQVKSEPRQEPMPGIPGKPIAMVKLPSSSNAPDQRSVTQTAPPPPIESKPDVAAALAPPVTQKSQANGTVVKATPTGPKNGRIMPAVPRLSPAVKPVVPTNGILQSKPGNLATDKDKPLSKMVSGRPTQVSTKSFEDGNRDARAAVAAAMAKLPHAPGQKKAEVPVDVVGNLAAKLNEMKTNDKARTARQTNASAYVPGHRGGRGGFRGGRPQTEEQTNKVEVPSADYDFASANAKFNKQDLVKEVIATGSMIGSPAEGDSGNNNVAEPPVNGARHQSQSSITIPSVASYDKTSSFFDNISSESKDRDDGSGKRLGGREFRSEEQKKNMETFGQGSVDNGYRGGMSYRGRARGRGHGRGRGYGRGGKGPIRGGFGAGVVPTDG